tara:strand:- start:840 stop:1556 length:717 start_codon:yes stop_codon:yes gene_type:complete
MFGVHGISERAIADQGILLFGTESVSANFTQTTEQNFISPASLDIIGNSEFSAFAAGTAAGILTMDANFLQSSAANRIRQTDADMIAQFDQTSTALLVASGVSEQSANFTQTTTQNFTASGVSEQSGNFTQTSTGNLIAKGLSTQIGDTIQTTLANRVRETALSVDSTFLQTTAPIAILSGDADIVFSFDQSTLGALLWENLDAGTNQESWSEITHTGDTWSEVSTSGTVETWTEMVK